MDCYWFFCIAFLIGTVLLIVLLSSKNDDLLTKSLNSFYDSVDNKINSNAFKMSLTLDDDVLNGTGKPIVYKVNSIGTSKEFKGIRASFGTENNLYDGMLLSKNDGMYFSSNSILGNKAYSFPFDSQLLEDSFLNLKNGSQYAFSQEDYDFISKFIDSINNAQNNKNKYDKRKVLNFLNSIQKIISDNIKTETQQHKNFTDPLTFQPLEKPFEYEGRIFTIDKEVLTKVSEALNDKFKDSNLQSDVCNYLMDKYSEFLFFTSEEELKDTVKTFFDEMSSVDTIPNISIRITDAVQDEYLFARNIQFLRNEEYVFSIGFDFNLNYKDAPSIKISISNSIFLKGLQEYTTCSVNLFFKQDKTDHNNFKYTCSAKIYVNNILINDILSQVNIEFSLQFDEKHIDENNKFSFNFDIKDKRSNSYIEDLAKIDLDLDVRAEFNKKNKSIKLTLCNGSVYTDFNIASKYKYTYIPEKLIKITKSNIVIELGGKTEKADIRKAQNLLKLNNQEIKDLFDSLNERINNILAEISKDNSAIKVAKRYEQVYSIGVDASYPTNITGNFIVDQVGSSEFFIYDLNRGKKINTLKLNTEQKQMHNGKFYYTQGLYGDEDKLLVMNLETLEVENSVVLSKSTDKSSDISRVKKMFLDGDDLVCFCLYSDKIRILIYNTLTDEYIIKDGVAPTEYCNYYAYDYNNDVIMFQSQNYTQDKDTFYFFDINRMSIIKTINTQHDKSQGTGLTFNGTEFVVSYDMLTTPYESYKVYYKYDGSVVSEDNVSAPNLYENYVGKSTIIHTPYMDYPILIDNGKLIKPDFKAFVNDYLFITGNIDSFTGGNYLSAYKEVEDVWIIDYYK